MAIPRQVAIVGAKAVSGTASIFANYNLNFDIQ
jgi:hypothetical protein